VSSVSGNSMKHVECLEMPVWIRLMAVISGKRLYKVGISQLVRFIGAIKIQYGSRELTFLMCSDMRVFIKRQRG